MILRIFTLSVLRLPIKELSLIGKLVVWSLIAGYSVARADVCVEALADDKNQLTKYEAAYLKKTDSNGLTDLDKLNFPPKKDPYLSFAESVAIAYYTLTYELDSRIVLAGACKLPVKQGVFYRGQKRGNWGDLKKVGNKAQLKKLESISASDFVAQGFLQSPRTSEFLIIKAKTARDISMYSQGVSDGGIKEEELLLLPGTTLIVTKTYTSKVSFFNEETGRDEIRTYPFVELEEL